MIPRILHFCFGLGDTPPVFQLVHCIAVRSAVRLLRPSTVLFHYAHEPTGPYWDAVRPLVSLVQIEPPREVFGRPLLHYAHRADVVRLQALIETGGIYLDIDTVCCRSWDDLLTHPCVLGLQRNSRGGYDGLCNAVILAEPKSTFLQEWLNGFRSFSNELWDEHSVRLPYRLARVTPEGTSGRADLHVEPPESFFEPSYTQEDLKQLFERCVEFPRAYCHHLWSGFSSAPYLSSLTERLIREVNTTYNKAARPHLPCV
jgi:hypothetical protein